jgi:hypothetical protein
MDKMVKSMSTTITAGKRRKDARLVEHLIGGVPREVACEERQQSEPDGMGGSHGRAWMVEEAVQMPRRVVCGRSDDRRDKCHTAALHCRPDRRWCSEQQSVLQEVARTKLGMHAMGESQGM